MQIVLYNKQIFGILFMDTFEIYQVLSLSFILDKQKGGGIYDKKIIFSIYYNITPILSCNYFTAKIAKASDFNFS